MVPGKVRFEADDRICAICSFSWQTSGTPYHVIVCLEEVVPLLSYPGDRIDGHILIENENSVHDSLHLAVSAINDLFLE